MTFGSLGWSGGGGTARYKTGTALLSERTVIADFENGYYYWNGAVKSSGDWPTNGNGRLITGIDWFPDTEWTVIVEHDADENGTSFDVNRGNGGARLLELTEDATSGNNRAYTVGSGGGTYATIDTTYSINAGRRRTIYSLKKDAAIRSMQDNAVFRESGFTMPRIDGTQASVGYRSSIVGDVFAGTVYNVSIIPRYLSSSEMKAIMATQRARTGVFWLGDSFLNPAIYPTYGMAKKWKALETEYRKCGYLNMGGTTLAEQYEAFKSLKDYHDCTLIIMDGGRELDGPGIEAEINKLTSLLNHNRWLYIEPLIPATFTVGTAARDEYDETNEYLFGTFPENIVSTYAALKAANDGSAGDLEDIDSEYDVCPRSLRSDDIHPNGAGQDVHASLVEDALDTRGW